MARSGRPSRARWPFLWDGNCVPPLATNPGDGPETGREISLFPVAPIRSCSRRGLPCLERRRPSGALLPHPFTLAARPKGCGGLLSVALSLGSPPPDIIRRRVSVEPGLSSVLEGQRPSSRLADEGIGRPAGKVKTGVTARAPFPATCATRERVREGPSGPSIRMTQTSRGAQRRRHTYAYMKHPCKP